MNLRAAIRDANALFDKRWRTHLVVELGGGGYEAIVDGAYDGYSPIHHVSTSSELTVSISPGNRKTGAIPSASLHPDVTCSGKGRPCYTRGLKGVPYKKQPPWCYALRNMADFRKTINAAWHRNCEALNVSRDLYFWQHEAYLRKHTPEKFRWFVGGGCPDQDYLDRTKVLASRIPEVKFLMFDKGYDIGLDYSGRPKHMAVILSTWPGMELPGKEYEGFAKSWLNIDPRSPEKAPTCKGYCTKCGMCWELGTKEGNIVLHVH